MSRRSKERSDGYSERWMGAFIADALESLDLIATCKKHEVSLADVREYRYRDPAFNSAMSDVDRSLDLAIREQLRADAAAGNARATSLLLRRGKDLDALAEPKQQTVKHETAAAWIAAQLIFEQGATAWSVLRDEPCPLCGHQEQRVPPVYTGPPARPDLIKPKKGRNEV